MRKERRKGREEGKEKEEMKEEESKNMGFACSSHVGRVSSRVFFCTSICVQVRCGAVKVFFLPFFFFTRRLFAALSKHLSAVDYRDPC